MNIESALREIAEAAQRDADRKVREQYAAEMYELREMFEEAGFSPKESFELVKVIVQAVENV